MERQSEKRVLRRQELQELRKLQIEEQRQMSSLNMKLTNQLETLVGRQEKEQNVSFIYRVFRLIGTFGLKLANRKLF